MNITTKMSECKKVERFELAIDAPKCRGSHAFTLINNERYVQSLTMNPPIIKISKVNKKVNELKLCVGLRLPCDDLQSLCYDKESCWYSITADKCCFTGVIRV